ncbi:hypothetical protein G7046_g6905 [Stylonectria norvegica]|nr:hypothetical protein G7046_g6905 [Stylonectria norvegica]
MSQPAAAISETIRNAFEVINSKNIQDFTDADRLMILKAGRHTLGTALGTGLGEHHLKIIKTYNVLTSPNSSDPLLGQAYQITQCRPTDEYTVADRNLIAQAAVPVGEKEDSLGQDSLSAEERKVLFADFKLRDGAEPLLQGPVLRSAPYDGFFQNERQLAFPRLLPARSPPRPESNVSRGRSVLAGFSAISTITGMSQEDPENISDDKARKLAELMRKNRTTFQQPPKSTAPRRHPPRLPALPVIGAYSEIDPVNLPNTRAGLETEIDIRHRDKAALLRQLVDNEGLLWKLKLKEQTLGRGRG